MAHYDGGELDAVRPESELDEFFRVLECDAYDRRAFMRILGVGGLAALGVGANVGSAFAKSAAATVSPATAKFAIIEQVAASFFQNQFNRPMVQGLKKYGVKTKLAIATEDNQAEKGLNEAAGYQAQGYNILILSSADQPQTWVRFVKNFTAQGKGFGFFDHSPSPIGGSTQNIQFDHRKSGELVGGAAVAWAKKHHVSQLNVGLLADITDPNGVKRTKYAFKAIQTAFPSAKLLGNVNAIDQTSGGNASASLIAAHPDMNVMITFNTLGGLGAYTSLTHAGKTDPKTFFLGTTDVEDATLTLIKKGTIYQANWTSYFPYSAVLIIRDAVKFLKGEKIKPTRMLGGAVITDAAQVAKYYAVNAHPFSPKYKYVYTDPQYNKYLSKPLKTGEYPAGY